MSLVKRLAIILVVLALISPIGLFFPELAHADGAWGEWGADEIGELAGYVPEGLARLSVIWRAALPDYAIPGLESRGIGGASLAYIASAVIGVALCAGLAFLLGKLLAKKDKR